MLNEILQSTGLRREFCAELLNVSPDQFGEWMDGVRPVPGFIMPHLAAVLGMPEDALTQAASTRQQGKRTDSTPAIWFKLRTEKLSEADLEVVGIVRKLGFNACQLHQRLYAVNAQYVPVFDMVRKRTDDRLPPALQGQLAARAFREGSGLGQGTEGIGELIRPVLRRMGVMVIESPIKGSEMEGCSFAVGGEENNAPCVFANTYKSTWFRRNAILLHELCHAIFDIHAEQATVDYRDHQREALQEIRADAFARESLVPSELLIKLQNSIGFSWDALTAELIAKMMARTHVEQRTLLWAAYEAGFIDREQHEQYLGLECDGHLRILSPHALSTQEYLGTQLIKSDPLWSAENRNVKLFGRTLRLPVPFVEVVIKALNSRQISLSRACELLMMDRSAVISRFGKLITNLT